MDVLISIKPKYVENIKNGSKKYEFRKKIFKSSVENVLIYSSLPKQEIVGYFKYVGYLSGNPIDIWNKCSDKSGISKDDFFLYFKNSSIAYAIIIEKFIPIQAKFKPKDAFNNFTPPQSFKYIDNLDNYLFKLL